jgi:hypothetical protein
MATGGLPGRTALARTTAPQATQTSEGIEKKRLRFRLVNAADAPNFFKIPYKLFSTYLPIK